MPIHKKTLSALPSVRQLRALVAVYHAGNVSMAAQELSVTQPAVTLLLRELEDRLGVTLFDRSTRRLRRTEAAVHAVGYAERALAEMEAMAVSMAELSGAHRGRVRITATAAVAQALLPRAIGQLKAVHPGIKVEIDEVGPGDFVEAIHAERTDFGVGTLEAPTPGLAEHVLAREALVAAALPSEQFRGGAAMTWRQLGQWPVITVRSGYGIRARMEAVAKEAGVALRIEHEVSLLGTAVAMAAQGLGVVVAPPSILVNERRLVTRRLTRPVVERVISVVYKRDRSFSPAAEAMLAALREVVGPGA